MECCREMNGDPLVPLPNPFGRKSMNPKIPVFDQTLHVYHDKIMAMSWDPFAQSKLMKVVGGRLELAWFNEILTLAEQGLVSGDGSAAPFETGVVVYNYLLRFQADGPKGDGWISFRDIRDSGPLAVYFADNVEKKIAECFSLQRSRTLSACNALGGYKPDDDLSCDMILAFDVLPSLRLLLLFNDSDDVFPASCKVLFSRGADAVLDTESLAILAVIFANRLCA